MWDNLNWHVLWNSVLLYAPRLLAGLALLTAAWFIANALQNVMLRLARVKRLDVNLTRYLGQAVRVVVLVFGVLSALGTLGVDVTALVAGLGLAGFALGFALKDILSNALSGILILLYKPFHTGDVIRVTDLEGTVTEINLRYTVLDAEGKTIFVPNGSLVANAVTVLKPVPPPTQPPGDGAVKTG